MIQHLDGLGESARSWARSIALCAAAKSYIGENTDGKGFLASLQRGRRSRPAVRS